jgi:hypothetical protein
MTMDVLKPIIRQTLADNSLAYGRQAIVIVLKRTESFSRPLAATKSPDGRRRLVEMWARAIENDQTGQR